MFLTSQQLTPFQQAPIINSWQGRWPKIHETCMIAPGAAVIGDVTLHQDVSIWYQCALRGDVFPIEIGEGTNVQDLTLVHCRFNEMMTRVGSHCTIGHSVVLHACTVGNHCLIGMGSVILDGAVISDDSIVGAHSLVTQKKTFPPSSLIMGSPAEVVRPLNEKEKSYLRWSAKHYIDLKNNYPLMGSIARKAQP